jgi:ABC-type Fe3+ transport system permease subunit
MKPHFQSIPLAMFPTLLMLTGEFPLSNFTAAGQWVAGFVAVIAVAIFAVPTSVLGAGFMQAVQKAQHREFTIDMD